MSKRPAEKKIIKAACAKCGGGYRNHLILAKKEISGSNDDAGFWWRETHQICQCQGCDEVRFRTESVFSEDYDDEGRLVPSVKIYPEATSNARAIVDDLEDIPKVGRIYKETILAFNAGAVILAGGGLRAIVEAICIDQQVSGSNLQHKIDSLVDKDLLAQPQADLLHEERFLGNAALHEISPPSEKDLSLGIDIVEGLLNTIYILPPKAARMKAARLTKATKASRKRNVKPN